MLLSDQIELALNDARWLAENAADHVAQLEKLRAIAIRREDAAGEVDQ